MKNYYQILGVSASATKDEIKEAYVKLSKKIHPDMNKGDEFFSELFKNINEAHQVLSDDEKRNQYNIQFNSYLYDFNYIKEKEIELHRRELSMEEIARKRKVLITNAISLIAGISVVALFSFSLDKPSEDETTVYRKPHHAKIALVENVIKNDKPSVVSVSANLVNEKATETKPELPKSIVQIEQPKPIAKIKLPTPIAKVEQSKPIAKVEQPKPLAKAEMPIVVQKIEKQTAQKNSYKPVFLSEYNMNKIVASIMKERLKKNKSSNVVSLVKYEGSNVENAFKLANVLRSNGFVLAGRETTSKPSKGIQVDCNGQIIKIIIGNI